MRWLSDNVLAKLQNGIAAPLEADCDPETEVDLHLKGQVFGDRFAIERWLGSGGMGTVYKAIDRTTDQAAVVKLIHPSFVGRDGRGAALAVLKEATALGALSKLDPHPEHVIRLLGTGTVVADVLVGETLELPWIALEFVDGGDQGTTLEDRVGHALRTTGSAFDSERAARAVLGIASGLDAVHAAGVVHRDVKPANVLCGGVGVAETMKLADFGVSRPLGMAATFGGLLVGTPGYAPPELMAVADSEIGPWSDVFGFAALTYFLLAGDHFFPLASIGDALRAVRKGARRSVKDAPRLHPALRANASACAALDAALAEATTAGSRTRTQTAGAFGRAVAEALGRPAALESRAGSDRPTSVRGPSAVSDAGAPHALAATLAAAGNAPLGFTLKSHREPGPAPVATRAAFDSAGACLAATERGLFLRERGSFSSTPIAGGDRLPALRFVEALGEGRWLVGGDSASFAVCTAGGISDEVRGGDPTVRFELFGGELGDLCVLVGARGERGSSAPALYALVGRHWLAPLPLRSAAAPKDVDLVGIARVDATRWLLVGREGPRAAYAAIYAPLRWEVTRIEPISRHGAPLVACAGDGNDLAVAAASDGTLFLVRGGDVQTARLPPGDAPTAVHVEPSGRIWVGGRGRLWTRGPSDAAFSVAHTFDGSAPVLAMATNPRFVALAADFSVIEAT